MTTHPEGLTRLIEELEKATGPSMELDEKIAGILGIDRSECCGSFIQYDPEELPECCGKPIVGMPKQYTSSLDAAVSLMPEGWRTVHAEEYLVRGNWGWTLKSNDPAHGGRIDGGSFAAGMAKTPAIALCIAALKARAEVK